MDHNSQVISGFEQRNVQTITHAEATPGQRSDRSRQFFVYALIAYVVSWAIEVPLALAAQGIISAGPPPWIHYLAAFGPGVAGVIMTWREGGVPGLRDLLARSLRWRVDLIWWLAAASPLVLFFAMSLVTSFITATAPRLDILNHFDFLPDMGLAVLLVWLATYGFGEEIGWRGYLLPRLQRNRTAWSASVILWAVWATWHVPSFFYLHTVSSAGSLAGFLLGILAGAVLLTWLYNSSGGSVLVVAVWHALFDYVTACIECKSGTIAAVLSTLVMAWAVAVVILYGRVSLSRRERHIL